MEKKQQHCLWCKVKVTTCKGEAGSFQVNAFNKLHLSKLFKFVGFCILYLPLYLTMPFSLFEAINVCAPVCVYVGGCGWVWVNLLTLRIPNSLSLTYWKERLKKVTQCFGEQKVLIEIRQKGDEGMCTAHHSSLQKHCQTNCLSADNVITQPNKVFSSKTWQE